MKKSNFPEKVIRVHLTLSFKGFTWQEIEWNLKETAKVLVLTRTDVDGEKITRHFPKEDFMKVNKVNADFSNICFGVMTTKEAVEDSKKELTKTVIEVSNSILNSINKLRSFI